MRSVIGAEALERGKNIRAPHEREAERQRRFREQSSMARRRLDPSDNDHARRRQLQGDRRTSREDTVRRMEDRSAERRALLALRGNRRGAAFDIDESTLEKIKSVRRRHLHGYHIDAAQPEPAANPFQYLLEKRYRVAGGREAISERVGERWRVPLKSDMYRAAFEFIQSGLRHARGP
ncbi:hypothetical protein EMIT0158MI4_20122 [Burkholderia ambifaria]